MTIEDLKKKKEKIEAELAKVKDMEKNEIEKGLKTIAQTLLKECKAVGYDSWVFDSDDGLSIRVGKPKSPSKGHALKVSAPDGKSYEFKSGADACRHFNIDYAGNSALRVLKVKGFKVA